MEGLLRELVLNVLSRLPAKDLMQCKCVCKLWFDIITDPQFIENYYLFFNSQQEQLLVIRTPNFFLGSRETEISIVSWNPNEPKGLVSSRVINHPYQYIHGMVSSNFLFPFGFWIDIMGPCNGIYFLRGHPNVIMNPSLSQFRALPESHFNAPHGTCTFTEYPRTHFPRFGFDPKTNDYKVVVLKQLYRQETRELIEGDWAVELYSLNSNSWKNLGANAVPFPFSTAVTEQTFAYVNNCCHWMGCVYKSYENENDEDESDGPEKVVLSFDMVNEQFRKIKIPKTTPQFFKCLCVKNLVPCSESTTIGLLNYYFVDQGTEELFCFDVWMMTDYWDEGSWIKRYNVGPKPDIYKRLIGYYGSNQSLWNDTNEKLVLYGFDSEEHTKDLMVCGNHNLTGAVRYMESPFTRGMGF